MLFTTAVLVIFLNLGFLHLIMRGQSWPHVCPSLRLQKYLPAGQHIHVQISEVRMQTLLKSERCK